AKSSKHGGREFRIACAHEGDGAGVAQDPPIAFGALNRRCGTAHLKGSPATKPSSVRSIGIAMNWVMSPMTSLFIFDKPMRICGSHIDTSQRCCVARTGQTPRNVEG